MTGTITKLDGTMKPIPGFSMCRRGETVTLGGCARGARYDTTTEYFKDEFVYVPQTEESKTAFYKKILEGKTIKERKGKD